MGRKFDESAVRSHEPDSKTGRGNRRQLFIIIGIFVFVILAVLGVFYYLNYVAPFNRVIITIDNTKISMRYFLDKTRIYGGDPISMIQTITEEELVKIMAPQYGIEVTDADVDAQLRNIAAGDAESISDVEFREWYRQQLNNNNVSDAQYREIIRTRLLTLRMQAYLAARVPTVTEQVHVYWIVVATLEEAESAIARLDAGESFMELAKEISIDETTKEQGGELGWFPPQVFTYKDEIAELGVNQYTSPIAHFTEASSSDTTPTIDGFFIFMVSEKDPAREVDETSLGMMQSMAFEDWYYVEIGKHDVKYNFNSEIYAWLNYQLEKY